jgi:large repetitive protein
MNRIRLSLALLAVCAVSVTVTAAVSARDDAPAQAVRGYTISVTTPPPPLDITTLTLPGAEVGVAYSVTAQATGGVPPYTWAVSAGTLPAGLTLNASTGAITGTPTATGSSGFQLRVTDSHS